MEPVSSGVYMQLYFLKPVITDSVLNAKLTPWLVQPTTFAEIDGRRTKRIDTLKHIFKKSKIPYQIVKDMHIWQLCHLAMVVPIADAYYETDIPEKVWKDREMMWKTARRLKRNFFTLHKCGIVLSPMKNQHHCNVDQYRTNG